MAWIAIVAQPFSLHDLPMQEFAYPHCAWALPNWDRVPFAANDGE